MTKVMEGGLKELCRISQDGDVHSVSGHDFGHLGGAETHVVTHDVKACSRLVTLNIRVLKKRGVGEVITAAGEGKFELVLLSEAE